MEALMEALMDPTVSAMVEWIGYACASAILVGLMPSFLKLGSKKAAPALGAALLSLMVLLFAVGIVVLEDRVEDLFNITNDTLLYLVLSGTLQGLFWLCLCGGLIHGEVSRVTPLTNLSTVGALGLSVVVFKTEVGLWKLCAILILLLGTLLIESRPDTRSNGRWAIFAFLALILASAKSLTDTLYLQQTVIPESVANVVRTAASMVVLCCIAVLGGAFSSARRITADGWIFLVLAGMSVGLAWLCNSRAEALGDPNYLAPIACAAFPVSLLGGRIFHREKFAAGALFGVLLVLAGMFGMMLEL